MKMEKSWESFEFPSLLFYKRFVNMVGGAILVYPTTLWSCGAREATKFGIHQSSFRNLPFTYLEGKRAKLGVECEKKTPVSDCLPAITHHSKLLKLCLTLLCLADDHALTDFCVDLAYTDLH